MCEYTSTRNTGDHIQSDRYSMGCISLTDTLNHCTLLVSISRPILNSDLINAQTGEIMHLLLIIELCAQKSSNL